MTIKKPAARFKFTIDRKSPVSTEQQLLAHVKIAMMMGHLLPGERLPSVRQLQTELGVGRNVVWRAYSKLADAGAVTIQSRRHAVVNNSMHAEQAAGLVNVFDFLARDVLERVQALHLNPQSFLRFLSHRLHESKALAQQLAFVECNPVQAQAFSSEISQVWDLQVPGFETRALRTLSQEERAGFRTVLTPLYHYEEVRDLFPAAQVRVVPLRLCWNQDRLREWRAMPECSTMAFILQKAECLGYGDPLARELNAFCPNLKIEVIPFRNSAQVEKLLRTKKYARALLSGNVLQAASAVVRNSPQVVRQPLQIEKGSLEEARILAGVVF